MEGLKCKLSHLASDSSQALFPVLGGEEGDGEEGDRVEEKRRREGQRKEADPKRKSHA